jgi:outer membrane protein assembly factor BamB
MTRSHARVAVAVVMLFGACATARPDDWPQWRGPLGQGTTSEKNLPPAAGTTSLEVLWKTPIPGEGVSSPIVTGGRVYVTTAYEGTERHAWDRPTFWASAFLACAAAGLSLVRLPTAWRSLSERTAVRVTLGGWTAVVLGLTTVVLAKPRWFWRFADPWTGPTVAPADLPWVEAFFVRPMIVLVCGSLLLLFIALSSSERWLRYVTVVVTLACSLALGLIAGRPDWFLQPSQPWLTWLVTGGVGLLAAAGPIGWLSASRRWILAPIGAVIAVAAWLFRMIPDDEFGRPLSSTNQIVWLVPAAMLLLFHAWSVLVRKERSETNPTSIGLFLLTTSLSVLVFVRANYLHPQTGVMRAAVCLDAKSGEVLWHTPIYIAQPEKRHSLNSLATPSPACDGKRVYADFGSGLAALDMNGRLLWLKRDADFGRFIRYGAGSSVVLADDRILIYRDSEFVGHGDHLDDDITGQSGRRPSTLTAYDKATGDTIWSVTPSFSHDSYMTPLVWKGNDRLEAIVATWKTLAAFDIADGSLLWIHPHEMQQIVPSPAVSGDCMILTGGNALPTPMMVVRLPTPTTAAETLWVNTRTGGNIVSPVCWDGLVFSASHHGVLVCQDVATGRMKWFKRLGSRCLASLVAGDGKLFVLDQEGELSVFAADTTGALLTSLSLNESCSATPALAANCLFVRTSRHVCCIAGGK